MGRMAQFIAAHWANTLFHNPNSEEIWWGVHHMLMLKTLKACSCLCIRWCCTGWLLTGGRAPYIVNNLLLNLLHAWLPPLVAAPLFPPLELLLSMKLITAKNQLSSSSGNSFKCLICEIAHDFKTHPCFQSSAIMSELVYFICTSCSPALTWWCGSSHRFMTIVGVVTHKLVPVTTGTNKIHQFSHN